MERLRIVGPGEIDNLGLGQGPGETVEDITDFEIVEVPLSDRHHSAPTMASPRSDVPACPPISGFSAPPTSTFSIAVTISAAAA